MTILYARPRLSYTKEIAERGVQTFREEWVVKSDSPTESRAAILAAVPAYGMVSVECPFAVCVKVTMDRDEQNPYLWHVHVEWASKEFARNPAEDQKQPDQRRPKWSFDFIPLPQAFFSDLDGRPFTDKAGTPMDPAPQIPLFVDEVTIQFYTATCDRVFDRGYMNATNTDTWNGAEQSTALIQNIHAEEVFLYGAYWFQKVVKILVNPRYVVPKYGVNEAGADVTHVGGWMPKRILNMGGRELKAKPGGGYQAVPIRRDGLVDGRPHPLDVNGVAMFPDAGGQYGTGNANLVWLYFRTVTELAFAPLGLIPPWT